MKNTAWKDEDDCYLCKGGSLNFKNGQVVKICKRHSENLFGDDEIETYEQESAMTKVMFSVLIVVIVAGFIIGPIIVNNL